jgi:Asp-tRNA(Asn)/Glu-tRNA(Gln) amidotransferase B subunit
MRSSPANPDKVEQAKAKPNLAGWFVGQVMKAPARRQGQPSGGGAPR